MTELLGLLQRHVSPALIELGEADMVAETIQRVLREGNGAVRQRQAVRDGLDVVSLTAVTD
jgi:carboxylate-amine ligase